MSDDLQCNRCFRKYKTNITFDKHIKLGRCKVNDNNTICTFCSKSFLNKYNKLRHEKKCPQNPLSDTIRLLQSQNAKLQEENCILKHEIKIVNNNITNNNIQNNVYITCKFGEENMEHMTKRQMVYLFNRCFGSIPEFAKLTYFNKNIPDNCNVYLPSIKDKYACVFKGYKWEMKIRDEVIDNIYESAEAFLIDKFDDLKEGLGKDTLIKYQRWLNEHVQDERENLAKEQIKLLLYNERDMVIELRKKQSKSGRLEGCILSIMEM
jgi:hypothetical protein